MKLIIGNKTYSSWSLRPWLLMSYFELKFEEVLVRLDQPGTQAEILKFSPSGKVPALIDGEIKIWDSLAIMEYLNEKFPEKKMYPEDQAVRALARSVTSEMHSGFPGLRQHLSFHVKRKYDYFDVAPALTDIRRIRTIWSECLTRSGGPFLFGKFSIADAMFAPVVCRFNTYGVANSGVIRDYCESIMNLPALQQWYLDAQNEDFIAAEHE